MEFYLHIPEEGVRGFIHTRAWEYNNYSTLRRYALRGDHTTLGSMPWWLLLEAGFISVYTTDPDVWYETKG
jgi:hypothetical protein